MGVDFKLAYHRVVREEDIPKLAKKDKERIRNAISEKLKTRPHVFGIPLRQSLKGYRKLRVGDYRVIFRIEGSVVKVFCIEHRSVVYQVLKKRV